MSETLRIGIIGFDTSHVPAFTRLLNDPEDPFYVPGGKVVAGFPSFSPDLEASRSRVEGFKKEVTDKWDVEMVSSIPALLARVDAVLLESVDGRRHLSEATPVIEAKRPLYIDKPLTANYGDAVAIMDLAQENDCPLFSSSSLRFDANILSIKDDPELGQVLACDAFSPATLDPTNPGLFWYGIHGVEILYTFMGKGCEKVRCYSTDAYDVVVGRWPEGRVATMRGIRHGARDYGVSVFAENGVRQTLYSREVPLYSQLLERIMDFFASGRAPVDPQETLEIMAFMQGALMSAEEARDVGLDEIV